MRYPLSLLGQRSSINRLRANKQVWTVHCIVAIVITQWSVKWSTNCAKRVNAALVYLYWSAGNHIFRWTTIHGAPSYRIENYHAINHLGVRIVDTQRTVSRKFFDSNFLPNWRLTAAWTNRTELDCASGNRRRDSNTVRYPKRVRPRQGGLKKSVHECHSSPSTLPHTYTCPRDVLRTNPDVVGNESVATSGHIPRADGWPLSLSQSIC